MQTVTFSREFRWPLGNNKEARYPPNVEIEVANEVVTAARKAGALKEKKVGRGSAKGNGTGNNHQPQS